MQTGPIGLRGAEVKSFWQVATGMYKAGGIQSLYRGCGLTCAKSAPSSAIIFLVYETMKSQFA
jgi:ornithine carrier protein